MFRIEMLPAGHGDSLFISYGSPDTPNHILIDGGPYYFFANRKQAKIGERQTLSRHLVELSRLGKKLELLVVTHIDGEPATGGPDPGYLVQRTPSPGTGLAGSP
jgi:hypothetical protein